MKSALLSTVLSSAAASVVIRLDPSTAAFKSASPIMRDHDQNLVQPDGTPVQSRQDYTERCPASATTTHLTCPFPHAKAYDHHDLARTVTTRVFLVNEDGVDKNDQVTSVDFTKRSVYLFKYDASDEAGNHAEQVVFGLILDDIVAPVINMCGQVAENWEAASNTELCGTSTVSDNYDSMTPADIKYTIQHMRTSDELITKGSYDDAKDKITTEVTGRFLVTLSANDNAGSYGLNGVNNCANVAKAVLVQDTTDPVLALGGQQTTITHECGRLDDGPVSVDEFGNPTHPYPGAEDTVGELLSQITEHDENGVLIPVWDAAVATDTLDTAALGQNIWITARTDLVYNKKGSYTITYDANDFAGNPADTVTRHVDVVDTQPPVVTFNAGTSLTHYAEDDFTDLGVTCNDQCDKALADPTTSWAKIANSGPECATGAADVFDDTKECQYVRSYTCEDATGLSTTISRTFTVVDNKAPMIHIVGEPIITVEATKEPSCSSDIAAYCELTDTDGHHNGDGCTDIETACSDNNGGINYKDQGATCTDYVDGNLDSDVKVSGDVVSFQVPGTYHIKYDCQDLSLIDAVTETRTVIVQDTTCPTVTLEGTHVTQIEAGFQYVDMGATATDDLDGAISKCAGSHPMVTTNDCWSTDGDTVNVEKAFYSRRSCRHIKDTCGATCQTGEYFITTYAAERREYNRVNVWCDMSGETAFTYKPVVQGDAVVPYTGDADKQGSCPRYGMEMAYPAPNSDAIAHFGSNFGVTASTVDYLCAINDATTEIDPIKLQGSINHDEITQAEEGEYHIAFHVMDHAGNSECTKAAGGPCYYGCTSPTRTVVVKDTLPPVISLHLNNDNIHTSDSSATGLNGVANPAGSATFTDPYTGQHATHPVATEQASNPFLASDFTQDTTKVANSFPTTYAYKTGGGLFMAEETQSSVNGWIIAAAASGVTGLALVAYANKQ